MYDIREYQKKKEEEKIEFLITMILEEININLENNTTYNTNFFITGYNNQLDIILNKLEKDAKQKDIDMETDVKKIPTSSFNLKIKATKKNNIIAKFILIENEFYKKIIYDNSNSFDFKENKLNNLYIFHALQTAYYHAGYDDTEILINNKLMKLRAINKTIKYTSKVVPLDTIKYNHKIEEDRINNIKKKSK